MKASGQTFPAAGSSQYASLKTNIIDLLVQQAEFAIEAQKLGLDVSDKEIQAQVDALTKKYFQGSQAKYMAGLKQQGFTDAEVRDNLREKLLEQKLYNAVTKNAKTSSAEIAAYYAQNLTQYQLPATRNVQEILVGKNKETLAQQIYAQLKAGGELRRAREEVLAGSGLEEQRRQVHGQAGQRRARVRRGRLRCRLEDRGAPQAGQHVAVRLVRDPADRRDRAREDDARGQGRGRDSQAARVEQAAAGAERPGSTGVTKSFCSGSKITYQAGYQPSPDPCAAIAAGNTTTT